MARHTITELHAALGTAIERLAPVLTDLEPNQTTWTLGFQPSESAELELHIYRATRAELDAIATALGARPGDITRTGLRSGGKEEHEVRFAVSGIPAVVSAWLPEPSEREQLLARLAQLDASDPSSVRRLT
ncbi:hypothetical protein GCM10027160_24040 [Streptomyces calidiresistens]|uniref:Uncharacterized protein n=2 Tax=Streptomyces calidiresistens TaxID=1485586 RepID=A0A7W3XZ61_9ACTN|nr:hypothetical protein [Streptomyces calidiresistens]